MYYSITLRTFLLSKTSKGYTVDEKGDFYHYNEIIDETYNELFKDMNLTLEVSERFKKDFCKYFYNREIGFEVFAQFQNKLENCLNNECFNLLKNLEYIRNMSIDDMLQNINITNDGVNNSKAKNLALFENKPENRLNIIYNQNNINETVIEYANNLNENHSLGSSDTLSHTKGFTGMNKFNALNEFNYNTDIQAQIFNIIDKKCFSQVF